MKTIHKLFLIATIALGLGFVACSDSDVVSQGDNDSKTNTHVSVSLKLSTGASTRAAEDYNYIGEWAGKDKIENITVYLVDGLSVTSKKFNVGTGQDYEVVTNAAGDITVVPKTVEAAIRTTVGTKKVYVLINAKTPVTDHLAKTKVEEFEKAYQETALALTNSGISTKTVETSASKLAVKNGTTEETIVMTNVEPNTLIVKPNITAANTIKETSPDNRVNLEVERAVARVMVTTANKTSFNVERTPGGDVIGTITNITWVLAQGENSLYVQRKSNWETPNHIWKPSGNADYWASAGDKYDYSGLYENYDTSTKFGGTAVPTLTAYSGKIGDITPELVDQLSGKFVLPTTHKAATGDASDYKKGNTAYVLIRAQFSPSIAFYADGTTSYKVGDDFFVGGNGKFYSSATNAVDPEKGGVVGQTVAKYDKGKVLYYAWINPDNVSTSTWYNSPVLRNNIYHIHITGFKNLGTNWNPLFPEDPDSTEPKNPDPKPGTENEPPSPIDPNDPLTTPETWMSVDVKVLPWKVHSYGVDLGI